MSPQDEAAAILSHYFRSLARAAGIRWTAHNDADLRRVADLLGDGVGTEIPAFLSPDANDAHPPSHTAPQSARARRNGQSAPAATVDDRRWMQQLAVANGFDAEKGKRS